MFPENFDPINLAKWSADAKNKKKSEVISALNAAQINLAQMAALLSPEAENHLESLAAKAAQITLLRFGKTKQLYTPIYLSNFCINQCLYCGFNNKSRAQRKILSPEEVKAEALFLKSQGFKNILLVAGDDPQVTQNYLSGVISELHKFIPSLSLEIAPKTEAEYRLLKKAGADGVVSYQETYDKKLYGKYHPQGPKKDFSFRLETPERAAKAGFHRVGIGALIGLGDYIFEGLSIYSHARYLMKNYWQTQITISLPRLRTAIDSISVPQPISDRKFTQLICALRLALPDVGIILSTREQPALRDGLIKLAVTQLSAGSKTEPGGYLNPEKNGEQFSVADHRSASEIARNLEIMGYDPVWKNWEGVLND